MKSDFSVQKNVVNVSCSSSSWYFLSYVGLGSPFTTSLYKTRMLPMKIYPCLSYHREINETNVNYTCNWQKVWDSSDSLNGNGCTLLIFIWSTIPLISGDFLTRWNAITVRSLRKGKEKGQFWGISYFWIEVFLKEVLGLFRSLTLRRNHLRSTFQVKARLYVNFIAVRKYNFLSSFLFCFVYKIFAVTTRNIIP